MTSTTRDGGTRQTLREFYGQLDRKWADAEALLLSLDVPTPVWVRVKTVAPEHRRAPAYHHDLGFIRHYGRWGICYAIRSVEDPDDCLWTPIARCSVEQRVEAARCFPELREKVLEAALNYAVEVENALGVLTRTLDEATAATEIPPTAASEPNAAEMDAVAPQPTDSRAEDSPASLLPALPMAPALCLWESDGGPSAENERQAA